ncbi:MAG: hypothetical protein AAF828_11880 [Bacteroidota bacterium]
MTTLYFYLLVFLGLGLLAYTINLLYKLTTRSAVLLDKLALYAQQKMASQEENGRTALKLQAYERLSLLMERMAVQNLLLRRPAADLSAQQYTASLLFAIREEFEHNVTQQVYVSDQLWLIILQARDNVSQLIVRAAEGAESGQQVANRLLHMSQNQPSDPIALAQSAIRRESATL